MNAQPCYTDLDGVGRQDGVEPSTPHARSDRPTRISKEDYSIDTVIHGDALTVLRGMETNSVDAIVTDPPAGIEFMGKEWDSFKQGNLKTYKKQPGGKIGSNPGEGADFSARMAAMPNVANQRANTKCLNCNGFRWGHEPGHPKGGFKCVCDNPQFPIDHSTRETFIAFLREVMTEALRVLKPGGHALVWALPRTSHWTATALEDAGFEIRDCVYHVFGSGFPKSLDVGKAIDRVRDDYPAIRKVVDFLRVAVAHAGVSVEALNELLGGTAVANHFLAPSRSNAGCPTWEQWLMLKEYLQFNDNMDAEVWRLNGRKGKPGDAWYEREVTGEYDGDPGGFGEYRFKTRDGLRRDRPATPEAQQWQGYGTALKPAVECWWLCRKPLAEPSIAANVLKYGTGGLNVDATRISTNGETWKRDNTQGKALMYDGWGMKPNVKEGNTQGRFPSHLLLSHSIWCVPTGTKRVRGNSPMGHKGDTTINDYGKYNHRSEVTHGQYEQVDAYDCHESCPIRALDEQSGVRKSGNHSEKELHRKAQGMFAGGIATPDNWYGDTGGASRYFTNFPPDDFTPYAYIAKASRRERNAGCEGLPESSPWTSFDGQYAHGRNPITGERSEHEYKREQSNSHPTVKPLALMRWLIRLITPPGGIVLDCFAGSGSTCVAAIHEGVHFIGIEQDSSYVAIAEARIAHAMTHEPEVVKVATKKVKVNDKAHDRHSTKSIFNQANECVTSGHADADGMEEVEDWDCHESCPIRILGEQSGRIPSSHRTTRAIGHKSGMLGWSSGTSSEGHNDIGGASKFFQQFPPDSLFAEVE